MGAENNEGFYDELQKYLKVPDWVANRKYFVNELVVYSGVMYRCIVENNDATFTPAKWESAGASGSALLKVYKTAMTAGQLTYTLPELPDANYEVQAFMNGLDMNFTLVGVNLTITDGVTAGSVTADDELKVFYFK